MGRAGGRQLAPRRLTSSKGPESGPAWSPDSTRIAFAAKRDDDEVNQIYVLDVVRGGEAQRVTAAPTAASVPRWSPDGQNDPLPGGDVARRDRRGVQPQGRRRSERTPSRRSAIYDSFPIRNFDHWIEESKTHLWVVDVAGDRKGRAASWPGRKRGGDAGLRRRRARRRLDAGWAVGRFRRRPRTTTIAAARDGRVAPLAGGRERRRAEAADAGRLGLRRAGVPSRRQGALLYRRPTRSR